jgi:hypothetical protein
MADDAEETMIPKPRLDAEIAKRKAAEERASTLQAQLTEVSATAASAAKEAKNLKAQVDGIPTLQEQVQRLTAELDTTRAEGAAHTAMLESGINDGSVRDYALHLYSKARAEAGDKAPDFAAWWDGQKAEPSAVLRPFLEQPAAATATATAEPAKEASAEPAAAATPPPSGQAGVRPSPAPPSPFAPGSIAQMSREDFAARKAEFGRLSINDL